MTKLIGHIEQIAHLTRLLQSGKLPSTMLFAGIEGIGKLLVAKKLAASLLCEQKSPPFGGCGECKQCHLFKSGNIPDFQFLDCLKKEDAEVERFRTLLHSLHLRTFSGGNRVIIIDGAEHMSLEASNLLLKSLEEPRPGNYFILISTNPRTLPQTLQSRCQIWFFDRLSDADLKHHLSSMASQLDHLDELVSLADGSLVHVEELSQHLELWREISGRLSIIAAGDQSEAISWASELNKEKETLPLKLHFMRILSRREMFRATDPTVKRQWAIALANLIAAERLIFDRYLGASNVLNFVLLELSNPNPSKLLSNQPSLIERVVV